MIRGQSISLGLVSLFLSQLALAQEATQPAEAEPAAAAPAAPAASPPAAAPAPAPAPPAGYMLVPIQPPAGSEAQTRYDVQYPQKGGALPPGMELPYEEGDPVPAGYRVVRQKRRGLIISGSIVLGVPWALSLAIAAGNDFDDGTGLLAIPVAGPWLMLATDHARDKRCSSAYDYCDEDRSGLRAMLVLDGLAQVAGASLLTAGLVSHRVRLVRDDVTVSVVPTSFGAGRYGLYAEGAF